MDGRHVETVTLIFSNLIPTSILGQEPSKNHSPQHVEKKRWNLNILLHLSLISCDFKSKDLGYGKASFRKLLQVNFQES